MRGFGQIAELAAIARPQVGAITNVGPVHLELVESLAGVARAKAELLAALPPGGTAIVPAAAAELEPYLALEGVEVVRNFSALQRVDIALVALGAYRALGLPLADVQEGAREILFSRWRGEEAPLLGGGLLINDCYNANP